MNCDADLVFETGQDPSHPAGSGMKDGPLSVDGSVESIVSTSKTASKRSGRFCIIYSRREYITSRVFKPPVQCKGFVFPSSMDKGNQKKG